MAPLHHPRPQRPRTSQLRRNSPTVSGMRQPKLLGSALATMETTRLLFVLLQKLLDEVALPWLLSQTWTIHRVCLANCRLAAHARVASRAIICRHSIVHEYRIHPVVVQPGLPQPSPPSLSLVRRKSWLARRPGTYEARSARSGRPSHPQRRFAEEKKALLHAGDDSSCVAPTWHIRAATAQLPISVYL